MTRLVVFRNRVASRRPHFVAPKQKPGFYARFSYSSETRASLFEPVGTSSAILDRTPRDCQAAMRSQWLKTVSV